jgi:hypothetical protein
MSANNINYSAMRSLGAYLSAQNNPDALRVTDTGDITVASEATMLFERASRSLSSMLSNSQVATDWSRLAHDALVQKLENEIVHINGKKLSSKDRNDLESLLADIKKSKMTQTPGSAQSALARGLDYLKLKNEQLAESIERIAFLENPENSKILPYVKPHISGDQPFRIPLEKGLSDYLHNEMGMDKNHAKGLAQNLGQLMTSYNSNIDESLEILKLAGQMKNTRQFPDKDLFPLAYLRVHHNLTLSKAKDLKTSIERQTINGKPTQIKDARTEITLMLTYQVSFGTAHAIAKQAAELKRNDKLKTFSGAQLTEIAKLMVENKTSFKDAKTISLQAGMIQGEIPANRDKALNKIRASLDSYKYEKLAQLLPAGWNDDQIWRTMSDGSRELKDTQKFGNDLMNFLTDSFAAHIVDETTGLSDLFLRDVGREKFNFGGGEKGIIVVTDPARAQSELEKFAPDLEVRKTLSHVLFQAGGNGILSAMSTALGRGQNLFSIVSSDGEDKLPSAGSDFWIDLQHTDDGKIHVTYTNYMKHIGMIDLDSDQGFMSINPQLSRNTPASATDHSAKGMVTIELDPEQLKRGIIDPKMVGAPNLSLKIDIS